MGVVDTGNGLRAISAGLSAREAPFHEIPVIDFAPMLGTDSQAKREVAAALRKAAIEVGFFYIRNHGVPAPIIQGLFTAGPAFFALPLEEKMKTHVKLSTNNSGYTPMLEENVNPAAKGDLHEAYDMAAELDADDPALASGQGLYGVNIWPEGMPEFREAMLAYHFAVLDLGRALFRAFALALGVDEDYFDPFITKPTRAQRIVYYPSQDGAIDEDQIGIGAHSDYECFTILAQHEVPALQVLNAAGEWIAAPPIPGTFVVNIGDMMARWSNDLFVSTIHRAINTTGRPRYSIPFFLGLNYDTLIDVLPGCVTPERPRKYEPVVAGDYVQSRFDATYGYRKETDA
ncbi:MAG TPA: 2-oxoglutarate and iron-dependent oxygenase domain-containing protein [Acidocella sp.]|nr:2-oxoglutarate and iron-dependent oxygenase domain-containing protein [Acidocella sp.]